MKNQSGRKTLLGEVMREEGEINLAKASLLLAKVIEYPDLCVDEYLRKIDLMGCEVKERIGGSTDPYYSIDEISKYLFAEKGFIGNEDDYYDPKNSFLNDVLDRKTGIPVSLSVLYMEIADRVGLAVSGVGFPGHFIVKYSGSGEEIFIDPFNRGKVLWEKDCKEILKDVYGDEAELQAEFLQSVTKKEILTRMLHNLKGIYINSKNYIKALSVTDTILVINPGAPNELKDRGLLYYQLECFSKALSDLKVYLRHAPENKDTELIRNYIPALTEFVRKMS